MGQASWPKSSREGIGVYTPTVFVRLRIFLFAFKIANKLSGAVAGER